MEKSQRVKSKVYSVRETDDANEVKVLSDKPDSYEPSLVVVKGNLILHE